LRLLPSGRACALGSSFVIATATVATSATITASASGTSWHVQAGAFNAAPPHLSTEITAFYPANVTLHRGDEVEFTAVGTHTVTFNALPLPVFAYEGSLPFDGTILTAANQDGGAPLNSGPFGSSPEAAGPPTYTLTVDAPPGNYHFTCRFHREMAGSITVVPNSEGLPSTDAANQTIAQAAINADVRLGKYSLSKAIAQGQQDRAVAVGVGATSATGIGAVSVLRFAPSTIEISVGQTLTFFNEDINAPHTVTFGPELPPPFPGAPPGFLPYGGNIISDPSDSVNSGFLLSQELVDYLNVGFFFQPPVPVPHRSASFTFTKPGVYHYICALHDELGMVGTVVVGRSN
jgi:plastocyanin